MSGFANEDGMKKDDSPEQIDAILIDDDEAIHFIWKRMAKIGNGRFIGFHSSSEFFQRAQQFNRSVPVYIDSDLNESTPGELIAKEIKQLGFETIYLQTAIPVTDPTGMDWLTAVIGKDTPWDHELGLQ